MTCPGGLEVLDEAERVVLLAGRVRWILLSEGAEPDPVDVARITVKLLAIYRAQSYRLPSWLTGGKPP